jgi:hypothetical protein
MVSNKKRLLTNRIDNQPTKKLTSQAKWIILDI